MHVWECVNWLIPTSTPAVGKLLLDLLPCHVLNLIIFFFNHWGKLNWHPLVRPALVCVHNNDTRQLDASSYMGLQAGQRPQTHRQIIVLASLKHLCNQCLSIKAKFSVCIVTAALLMKRFAIGKKIIIWVAEEDRVAKLFESWHSPFCCNVADAENESLNWSHTKSNQWRCLAATDSASGSTQKDKKMRSVMLQQWDRK